MKLCSSPSMSVNMAVPQLLPGHWTRNIESVHAVYRTPLSPLVTLSSISRFRKPRANFTP